MSPRRKSSRADGKSPDALSSSNVKVVASNGNGAAASPSPTSGSQGHLSGLRLSGTDSAMLEKQNFV
jgi:hypothetical protein